MPIYDFKCTSCQITKERLTSSQTTTTVCPECGSEMNRLISGSQSFYFKGEGTYGQQSMNKSSLRGKR